VASFEAFAAMKRLEYTNSLSAGMPTCTFSGATLRHQSTSCPINRPCFRIKSFLTAPRLTLLLAAASLSFLSAAGIVLTKKTPSEAEVYWHPIEFSTLENYSSSIVIQSTGTRQSTTIPRYTIGAVLEFPSLTLATLIAEEDWNNLKSKKDDFAMHSTLCKEAAPILSKVVSEIDQVLTKHQDGFLLVRGQWINKHEWAAKMAADAKALQAAKGPEITIGKMTYRDVKVTKVVDGRISIMHEGGIANIMLSDLSALQIAILKVASPSIFAKYLAEQSDGNEKGKAENKMASDLEQGSDKTKSASKFEPNAKKKAASGVVIAWGANDDGECDVPSKLPDIVKIGAGGSQSVAISADGKSVAWGKMTDPPRFWRDYNRVTAYVPSNVHDVVSMAVGVNHSIAILRDGRAMAWGYNNELQCLVPPFNSPTFIAAACGPTHSIFLDSKGGVSLAGSNQQSESTLPPTLVRDQQVIAVSAGLQYTLVLLSTGKVIAWGLNNYGQCNVPNEAKHDIVAIAASTDHSLALTKNGYVLAWGRNDSHESEVPSELSDVVAIAAGTVHNLALKRDGTVAAWGKNNWGQLSVPPGLKNVVGIAAGGAHNLVLVRNPNE